MLQKSLNHIALSVRKSILESLFEAKSGHLGGSLGLSDNLLHYILIF